MDELNNKDVTNEDGPVTDHKTEGPGDDTAAIDNFDSKVSIDGQEARRAVVKGYLRPDGTYYVSIPKEIRQPLNLKGGEYFLLKVKPKEKKISARVIDLFEE